MATQMLSQLFTKAALPPPHLLLFELVISSAVIGFTSSRSPVRPAAVPLLGACVYSIVRTSNHHMRSRWASLLGGSSFTILLQYLDLAVISRWSYRSPNSAADEQAKSERHQNGTSKETLLDRLKFGWNSMWAFRRVGTPEEVKNVPPFSTADPSYAPSRWKFVTQQAAVAFTCYLLLDLLSSRKPPANAHELFNPELVPLIARLSSVTAAEIKLRALTIAGFAVTFYCVIQGFQSFSASVAVALGLSKVENWRPAFGSLADAYCLKNLWGKFWHQLLRRPLTGPSSALVHHVLNLPRGSPLAGSATLILTFALSGVLHTIAGVASGMPLRELGVFRFFCTQGFGVLLEQAVISIFRRANGRGKESERPSVALRALGYVWVAAFMTWSGPAWIYPQAARQSPEGAASILPFSIVNVLRRR